MDPSATSVPKSLFRILSLRALPRVACRPSFRQPMMPPADPRVISHLPGAEAGADTDMAFSYGLSILTAGLPPQNVDFEEAMDLVGLEGEDRKTYTFNSENTRISKKAACNLCNAARPRLKVPLKIKGKAPAAKAPDGEENLREAFTLLPHQIAGMYFVPRRGPCSMWNRHPPVFVHTNARTEARIINDYISGPIPYFMLGVEMGLGKTITFELSWHVRARQLKEAAATIIPSNRESERKYGPHLLVTPGELVDAMVADCQNAFRGIREYVIINSTGRSSIPGATVYSTAADVVKFMRTVYDRRHDPSIMDTTIVMGYELFAKRLLESKVVFELEDGKIRTDAGLAKRAKAQTSTIDWHHTRKVLMHSCGEAHGSTPPKQG
ncbi:hypothetical protein B0H63DRAFT_217821 [Podospora didyma]|uniref:Uncharacterized protein n=1 Tax=Podospora didyma TaxID=330526 RepID=A0AAE0NI79_9PEZI|nr:hypothetical protein B0H63DRAFT_217821 [Podospora didyma]